MREWREMQAMRRLSGRKGFLGGRGLSRESSEKDSQIAMGRRCGVVNKRRVLRRNSVSGARTLHDHRAPETAQADPS